MFLAVLLTFVVVVLMFALPYVIALAVDAILLARDRRLEKHKQRHH